MTSLLHQIVEVGAGLLSFTYVFILIWVVSKLARAQVKQTRQRLERLDPEDIQFQYAERPCQLKPQTPPRFDCH